MGYGEIIIAPNSESMGTLQVSTENVRDYGHSENSKTLLKLLEFGPYRSKVQSRLREKTTLEFNSILIIFDEEQVHGRPCGCRMPCPGFVDEEDWLCVNNESE